MPSLADIKLRDFVRYTGDGLPGEPVGHPAPTGDPKSGVHNPTKKDLRDIVGRAVEAADDIAAAAAAMGVYPGQEVIVDAYKLAPETDDTGAIDRALATGKPVRFGPRDYVYNGSGFQLVSGQVLLGSGGVAAYGPSYSGSSTRIIATGSGASLFSGASNPLNHIRISGMTIYVTGAYDWVMDFGRMSGFDLANLRIEIANNVTGGIRTQKGAITDSSWVLNWANVRMRLPDASAGRTFNIDMGDGAIIGCDFTGGRGALVRGTGGLKIVGNRFDRSSGYGLTIECWNEARVQHIISSNQIEENDDGGILINADANDARVETWVMTNIVGNFFRSRATAVADVVLVNNTGAAVRGGNITGNVHSTNVKAVTSPPSWTRVNISAGQTFNGRQATSYVGDYLQAPLVLAQGAGSVAASGTSETTVLTVPVPGGSMGAKGIVRARLKFTHSNNANAKTIRVRLGSLLLASLDGANALGSVMDVEVHNDGTGAQLVFPGTPMHGLYATAVVAGTINTSLDQSLTVSIQLANGADSAALRTWAVTITPAE